MQDARSLIEKTFADLAVCEPHSIEQGGHGAAFDANDLQTTMESGGFYACTINLWWLHGYWNATPDVPINETNLQRAKDFYFKEPLGRFPFELVVVGWWEWINTKVRGNASHQQRLWMQSFCVLLSASPMELTNRNWIVGTF